MLCVCVLRGEGNGITEEESDSKVFSIVCYLSTKVFMDYLYCLYNIVCSVLYIIASIL